jgi:hypothetical protein
MAIAAGGLALGPAPALAQDAPEPATSTPATDAIGPRELQNFNLQGTVTRQAQQPPPAPATTGEPAARTTPPASATAQPAQQRAATADVPTQSRPSAETPQLATAAPAPRTRTSTEVPPSSSVTVNLPPVGGSPVASRQTYSQASSPDFTSEAEAPASLAPQRSFPIIPWLLAALSLGAGLAFLFFRNRARHAYAGGPHIDLFAAPEPAPRPRPRPAPAPPPPPRATPAPAPALPPTPASTPTPAPEATSPKPVGPKPVGIVSTRLRPWVELGFKPTRCVLDEENVTFEFELELFNSGSAAAREVLLEATIFNAGPAQDSEIAAFFSSPVGQGDRIAAIGPLKRVSVSPRVTVPRNGVQLFEVAGRQVFVPLIGFNVLYRWGGGEGQTSNSFLLGRDTKGEKLAPFRIDLGPRVFRGLGARPLPQGVRN